MLKITKPDLPDILLLEYEISRDNRAVFYRTFSQAELHQAGIPD